MIDARIRGSKGLRTVAVTEGGALVTAVSTAYSVDDGIVNLPAGRRFAIDGTGSTDLIVDGSVGSVDAYIDSDVNGDLFLTTMSVLIADATVDLNKFGGLTALTNGCQLFYEITDGRFYYPLEFKTNFDFIRLSTLMPGLGTKNDAFKLANAGAVTADAYAINIDLTKLSPLDFGIRIRRDTQDKFGIRINDNLAGLVSFDIICSGYVQLG